MIVGVLRIDLRVFEVQTLKQKRSVVSRTLNRIRSRYPVSAAEVGKLDLLQRTLLGVCMVAGTEAQIESVFRKLENDLYQAGHTELLGTDIEFLHYGEES